MTNGYLFAPTVSKSGIVSKWVWDFGDGKGGTINNASPLPQSNVYANPGTFTVTLTVYDSSNRALKSRIRQVTIAVQKRSRAARH